MIRTLLEASNPKKFKTRSLLFVKTFLYAWQSATYRTALPLCVGPSYGNMPAVTIIKETISIFNYHKGYDENPSGLHTCLSWARKPIYLGLFYFLLNVCSDDHSYLPEDVYGNFLLHAYCASK